ncbi:MAG: phosphoribosyltransferase family protein [Thermoprotei archaeon]
MYLYPQLLELSVNLLLANDECGAKDFDKIVTVVQNGVPLATLVSLITKKPLVIVKRRKESLLLDYYEEPVREGDGSISFLYVRKDYVRKGDKFLFVDDVIRSGKTLLSVKNLIDKAGASIVGALTLVSLDPESVKSLGFSVCKLL